MQFLKKLIPEALLKTLRPAYHGMMASLANLYYGRPSDAMVLIGVTGTAGKSTTTAMLAHILNANDHKCGYMTTVELFDGEILTLNKHGLSMPGGPLLQKQLRILADKGCKYAVVECTSEGLEQNRHFGINFDIALFTNLSRAHIEAHGSFANYQKAKGKLFEAINNSQLTINKKQIFPNLKKSIGANLDDPMSGFFISFPAEEKFGMTFNNLKINSIQKLYRATLKSGGPPIELEINTVPFEIDVLGEFNSKNAALAAACANILGVNLEQASTALKRFKGVRGRMEGVPNNRDFTVIVDYGCEPASFAAAVEAAAQLPHNNLIHVFGSTGGHRDISKRFEFGKTSAQFADYIIITNDDIYDSDAAGIAANIEEGIKSFKLRKPEYEIILDRRSAITKALSMAKAGDIVLLTGKGSEQFLVLHNNNRINWDEVTVVKEILQRLPALNS